MRPAYEAVPCPPFSRWLGMHTFAEAAAEASDDGVYSLYLTSGQARAVLRALKQAPEDDVDVVAARTRLANLLGE
jgi:phosphoheptose isomerase